MRKSREEKIIKNAEDILKELENLYSEGIAKVSYEKLLKEYKKIHSRYVKVIKVSDNMGAKIILLNEKLEKNLSYTIDTARTKLLENVDEHKKTKENIDTYKKDIESLKKLLLEVHKEKLELENKLSLYMKNYGEINHQFQDKDLLEEKSLEELLSKKNTVFLYLIQYSLESDHYESVTFLTSLKKHISNLFALEEELFQLNSKTFLLFSDKDFNCEKLNQTLNQKRVLRSKKIIFNVRKIEV